MSREIKNLTVLMTTFNGASYIAAAIKSILNQSFCDFEFLIIDDGSIDDSEKIIKTFSDDRIIYKKIEHSGRAEALNYGLKTATYDWVALMDDDDIAHPERLLDQVKYLNKYDDIDVVSCWYAVFKNRNILYPIFTKVKHEDIVRRFLLSSDVIHAGMIYNRIQLLEFGGYKEPYFEDYDLWIRSLGKLKFANIPKILYYVRYRNNSMSRQHIHVKNQIHNRIMDRLYTAEMLDEFDLDQNEKMSYKGWREYFYGSTSQARTFWYLLGLKIFLQPRMVMAYLISYLPKPMVITFKELRMRFRLNYWMTYFSKQNRKMRDDFYLLQ